MEIKSYIVSYLLFPVVAFITGIFMIRYNKLNKVLSNKKLIIFILLSAVAMAVPGLLGLLSTSFIPSGYLLCQLIYLLLGGLYLWLLLRHFSAHMESKKGFITVCSLVVMLLGAYLFSLVFNYFGELHYGLVAAGAVIVFIIPLLFYWTYIALLNIPSEIYKVWHYNDSSESINLDHIDFSRLLVLEVEMFKEVTDPNQLKVKVKAPPELAFGSWFRKFIDDYNYKFPNSPIRYSAEDGDIYGWIFYVKPSWFKRRIYIDPEKTIAGNGLLEKYTIVSKRVTEKSEIPKPVQDRNKSLI